MASFVVSTAQERYSAHVQRGILRSVGEFAPSNAGTIFTVTTADVWKLHGETFQQGLGGRRCEVLYFPGGEQNKRLSSVELLADEMMRLGADRTSVVIGFGGGIVTDVAGFLAAIFMRGIPVIQVPTTLLAQMDAAVGGKTGVNLVSGKNLIGSFHQPLAVLIDPDVIATLPEREYRAGLYEIIKCGVIRSRELFERIECENDAVLRQDAGIVDYMIGESVRIKAEVVSADEKEGGLRRILNFGHTVGHALEAETRYERFLHGEAVAFGMKAATELAFRTGLLGDSERARIVRVVDAAGPIPALEGITAESLMSRLQGDKKTVHGVVHFVLPDSIGNVRIVSGLDRGQVLASVESVLRG